MNNILTIVRLKSKDFIKKLIHNENTTIEIKEFIQDLKLNPIYRAQLQLYERINKKVYDDDSHEKERIMDEIQNYLKDFIVEDIINYNILLASKYNVSGKSTKMEKLFNSIVVDHCSKKSYGSIISEFIRNRENAYDILDEISKDSIDRLEKKLLIFNNRHILERAIVKFNKKYKNLNKDDIKVMDIRLWPIAKKKKALEEVLKELEAFSVTDEFINKNLHKAIDKLRMNSNLEVSYINSIFLLQELKNIEEINT
ncbi:MAG: hypothetical protein ACFFG0_19700 [Candidatus Thorarchaeota archaeon]